MFSINTQLQWENQFLQILPIWNTDFFSLIFLTIGVLPTEKSRYFLVVSTLIVILQ